MDLLQLTFLIVMLTKCCSSTKAMGLCDFEDKFPCDKTEGLKYSNRPGCRNQTVSKEHLLHQPVTTDSSDYLSSIAQLITEPATSDQVATDHSSTGQAAATHGDEMVTGHSTNNQPNIANNYYPVSNSYLTTYQVATGPTGNAKTDERAASSTVTDQKITDHSTRKQIIPVTPGSTVTGQVSTSHGSPVQVISVSTGHSAISQETINNGVTDQVPSGHSTSGTLIPSHPSSAKHSSTGQLSNANVASDQTTLDDSKSDQTIPNHSIFDGMVTSDAIHRELTTAYTTSDYARSLIASIEPTTVACPDGLMLVDGNCVPQEECTCFVEGHGEIQEGEFYISSDCGLQCNCSACQLVCDYDYQCSVNAVCEELDGIRRCYCNAGYEGDGVTCISTSPATDCLDVFNSGNTESDVYYIKPTTWSGSPFGVFCNMTDGGGWTVIQRRVDGSVNFNLFWDNFKNGFGYLDHELWLGNEKIFSITDQKDYQLRIDFVNRYGIPYYAKYDYFRINNEDNNYRLTIGEFWDGNAGNSFKSPHNNKDFSTRDQDNDKEPMLHIAADSGFGAWWYGYVNLLSDLNADYYQGDILWSTLPGSHLYIKFTEMKIRPV